MAAGRAAYSGPEWSELDDISLELKASLNIPNLRPFLRAKHLLTEAELEQVEYSPANPRDQAIDKLVSILKTKGPHHAEVFLEVLKLSLQQDDSHLGHVHLSKRLEEVVRERKDELEMDALVQAEGHIPVLGNPIPVPVHTPARHYDSGLGNLGMSCSTSSSQETGSIQSADLSGLSGGSYNDFRSHGPLPIRGLDKFENEPAHHQGLDERQVSILKHKIISDTSNITQSFAIMVVGVYRLLKQNNAPVDEVKLMLQYLGCHPAVSSEKTTLFSGSNEISESKDLLSLIECLRKYSSWYNYRLMKVVAEQFAGDEGKKLISDYEMELRKYYVTVVAYQCPDFSLDRTVPPGYTSLIVKVDWDYLSTSPQDIATFQASLADILELAPYVFQLRSVEEGCVRLNWSVPAALEPHLSRMMMEKQECLRDVRVLTLEVASVKIDVPNTHSTPQKHRTSSDASLVCPQTPRKMTLSASSSIASILDVPMTSTEAELLSLYDSGGSVDGDPSSCLNLTKFFINEEEESAKTVSHTCKSDKTPKSVQEFGAFKFANSPSVVDLVPTAQAEPVGAITRTYCSEGNLLSEPTHATLRYGKEGLSLPDLPQGCVASEPVSRARRKFCRGRVCGRQSIVCCLRKLPKNLTNRLNSSRKNLKGKKEERGDWYCSSPTLLPPPRPPLDVLELADEPRKPGNVREIAYTVLSVKSDNELCTYVPQTTFPGVNVVRSGSITDVNLSDSLKTLMSVRRDSVVPSSPASSPTVDGLLPSFTQGERGDKIYWSNQDSGVGSSFNSTYSNSNNKPFAKQSSPQMSSDSTDTAAVASYSTAGPSTLKHNSYSSHHYVNFGYSILEDPDNDGDDVTNHTDDVIDHKKGHYRKRASASFPQYPAPVISDGKSPSEDYEWPNRSRSHGEEYYHRVHTMGNRIMSSMCSPQSSGYASYASSIAQGVDTVPAPSQESLDPHGGRRGSELSSAPPASGPFPPRPPVHGRVKRTSSLSLKRYHRFATSHGPPPPPEYHNQSLWLHRSN